MRSSVLLVLGALTLCPPARAGEAPDEGAKQVKTLIVTAINTTIDVLKDTANDREARRRKIYAIMDPVVDWALMGKLTLGRTHWAEFTEVQRKEFIESFGTTFRDSVFDKVEVYTNETVEFDEAIPAEKGKYQMHMSVISKGDRYKIIFKVYRSGDSWKVYDVEVEGISMVRTYAAQYDQVLQKGSPKDLLAKLKAKALAVPDDFTRATQKSGSGRKK